MNARLGLDDEARSPRTPTREALATLGMVVALLLLIATVMRPESGRPREAKSPRPMGTALHQNVGAPTERLAASEPTSAREAPADPSGVARPRATRRPHDGPVPGGATHVHRDRGSPHESARLGDAWKLTARPASL